MEYFTAEASAYKQCFDTRRLNNQNSAGIAAVGLPLLQIAMDAVSCARSNAFAFSFLVCLFIAFGAYTLSKITKNDSWIDRGWSVFPVIYAWIYVVIPSSTDSNVSGSFASISQSTGAIAPRFLFALCVTLWGSRMTFNFYRRGGYFSGGEDYRWEHVRKFPMFQNKIVWELFSFGFVSLFQSLLLWAETLPLLALPSAYSAAGASSTAIQYMTAGAFLVMLFAETLADEQQWVFQNGKYKTGPRYKSLEADYKRGFLTQGLFAYTRHPNVFSEQSMWVIIYTLSVTSANASWGFFNVSGIGALALVILTVRSCVLTEEISAAKYPDYKKYQAKTNSLVPSRIPAKF
jgi:steroid 5-alpha reductase family enzyme